MVIGGGRQEELHPFVFNNNELCLSDEWSDNFDEVLETVDINNAIVEQDMQIDNRNVVYEEEE